MLKLDWHIEQSISSPVYVTRKSREICTRASAFSCLLTFKAFGVTSTTFTSLESNILNNTRYRVVKYYNITTKLLWNWKPAWLIEDPKEIKNANFELTSTWEMVGKRSHEIDNPENIGNTAELSHNEEDKLLGMMMLKLNSPQGQSLPLQNNPTTRWERHF